MIVIGNIKTGFGIKVERINASARNRRNRMSLITVLPNPGATGSPYGYGELNGLNPHITIKIAKGIIRLAVIYVMTNITIRFFMLAPFLL